jgi:hypothetical protein
LWPRCVPFIMYLLCHLSVKSVSTSCHRLADWYIWNVCSTACRTYFHHFWLTYVCPHQLVRFSHHRSTLLGLFFCFGFVFEVFAPFCLYQMSERFTSPLWHNSAISLNFPNIITYQTSYILVYNTVQYSTVQCTIQYSTLYNTVQYSTVYSTVHCTIQYNTVYNTVQYTVQYGTV